MYESISRAAAVALMLLLGACSGDEEAAKSTAPADSQAPTTAQAGGPTIQVAADKTHAVQPGDEITLSISTGNFALDAAGIGASNKAGSGHYRVFLDQASGDEYLAASADATIKIRIPQDVTDGSHDLRIALYNNDKTPLDPPAETSVLLIIYRL